MTSHEIQQDLNEYILFRLCSCLGRALLLDGAWEGKMCLITFDSDGGTKVLSEMHNAILYLIQNFLVVLF